MDPDPDPDLTIVLLGKTGVGKSASGNTILGRAVFKSDFSFKSVTKEIRAETGRVFEKRISVVDTPGILDSEETTENIKNYCQNLLRSNKPCLFLVVLSIGRFTEEDQKAVTAALKVLGSRGLKKSYLLFTNGDKLKGRPLTDFIFEEKEGKLPDVLMMFSGACHLFNNEDGDQEQVRDLLLKTGYLRDHQPPDPAAGLEDQRRIVLLGLPGVGKSSSGNTILGSEKFKSASSFDLVSTECVSESASVDGRLIQVVDTPGFTDEVLDPEQLYEEIMKTLVEASPGPHAFIIVVRIGNMSEADRKLFELLPKLFGGDASKYTMVLFTHGDGLRGRSIDQLIQSSRYVSDLVSMCDGRYCVFDNTQNRKRLQVRDLLSKIDEMVEANGGEHYTSDMFKMAETFIREEKNRAAQSVDSNRPDQSVDRNRPDQSVDRNRPDQSVDSNHPDQSVDRNRPDQSVATNPSGISADSNLLARAGGDGGPQDKRKQGKGAWETLKSFLKCCWERMMRLAVIALIVMFSKKRTNCPMRTAAVMTQCQKLNSHNVHLSASPVCKSQSNRVPEEEELSLQTRSREKGRRKLSEEP